jgi:hypothetical protein
MEGKLTVQIPPSPYLSTRELRCYFGLDFSDYRTKPYATVAVIHDLPPNNDRIQNVICQFMCGYLYKQSCNSENRVPL